MAPFSRCEILDCVKMEQESRTPDAMSPFCLCSLPWIWPEASSSWLDFPKINCNLELWLNKNDDNVEFLGMYSCCWSIYFQLFFPLEMRVLYISALGVRYGHTPHFHQWDVESSMCVMRVASCPIRPLTFSLLGNINVEGNYTKNYSKGKRFGEAGNIPLCLSH